MKEKIEQPKFIEKVSARETMLAMKVKQTSIFPTAIIKTKQASQLATRLKSKGLGAWSISEKGLINEIKVTRIA